MCNVFTVDLKQAVASRFQAIKGKLVKRQGQFDYHGSRTDSDRLGTRFHQVVLGDLTKVVPSTMPRDVLAGRFDAEIQRTYDDAASAEWFYRNEKAY